MTTTLQQDLDNRHILLAANARLDAHGATPVTPSGPRLKPLDFAGRSGNDLRPATFAGMVGQERLKTLLGRIVGIALTKRRTLDHMLLIGSAGTGKTTLAQVIAHELGRDVFMLKAPVAYDVFLELLKVAKPGDVVVIDEIHMQVSGDRRGITQAADPELFYHVLEDQRLMTDTGMLPFPDVTFIGCTTDAGLLPQPFLDRFPIQPQLDPYTADEMCVLATRNAQALGLQIDPQAARVFAHACRNLPRQINSFVKNARGLAATTIDHALAVEVVTVLNSTTLDGLTRDMQRMLAYLLTCRRTDAKDRVSYKAGLGSIATALGKSRDSKAVALYVEPYLIERGYIAITHGGRELTDRGIQRAEVL